MKLFLNHNKGYIFIYFLSLIITLFYSCIKGFIGVYEVTYIIILNTFILLTYLVYKFIHNRELYKLFDREMKQIDESILNLEGGSLSKDVSRVLKDQYQLYMTELDKESRSHLEHIEFVNQWIHQMKTPLSVIKLQLKEFEGEERADALQEEITKLNKGLNMALNYSRLDSFEKDFVAEKVSLRQIVLDVINENKRLFIKSKIKPIVEIDDDIEIVSDIKWMKFVIEQLLTNAVKYSFNKGKEIIFKADHNDKEINLKVIDYGIGIYKKDIKRVFDKFFTGENGRKYGESTGMGLYIAKQVLNKLGHKIYISSEVDKGTEVIIEFRR